MLSLSCLCDEIWGYLAQHFLLLFSNYEDVIRYFKTNQQLLTSILIVDFGQFFFVMMQMLVIIQNDRVVAVVTEYKSVFTNFGMLLKCNLLTIQRKYPLKFKLLKKSNKKKIN